MIDEDAFGGAEPPSNVIPFPAMRPNAKLSEAWAAQQAEQNKKLGTKDEFLTPAQCVDQIIRRRSLPLFQWPAAWPLLAERCRCYAGDVVIVTGPTGSGKTSWAIQVALAFAAAGIPILWCALELDPTAITERIVANLHGVHTMFVKEQWSAERIRHSVNAVTDMWHFVPRIMDPDAQLAAVRRGIALCMRTYRIKPLVVLDYLGKLAALERDIRLATIQAAEKIRALAVEEECYVLLLAQPSRAKNKALTGAVEHGAATETSGAAAESGEAENAASIEINLEVFKEDDADALDARWHVAKSRHVGKEGQTGARFTKAGGVWSELDSVPVHPLKVAAEESAQKKDRHRTEPPMSKAEIRKALNVEAAGDAAAKRRARLLAAIRDGGMFGLEEHAMKHLPGVGRGLTLQQDLQELARSGAVESKPGRRWVAVIR
jgi:hypothetical protein